MHFSTLTLVGIAVVLALIAGGVYVLGNSASLRDGGQVACTMEAKLCPDGSYVGREGPNCEFAACPDVPAGPAVPGTPSGTTVLLETKIDQGASGLDVKVVPVELLEDSRCPIDVTCVWAGRVRVRVQLISGLGTANQVFELDKPITTEAEEVTLVDVRPSPRQDVSLEPGDYTFVFRVTKRTDLVL